MSLRTLLLWGVMLTAAASDVMELTLLPESTYGDNGGRCLDGTMAGYYYAKPSSGSSSLWVFSMDGGGACEDEASCKQWMKKKCPSTSWKQEVPAKGAVLSSDPAKNPDFHNAHKVRIPYCTGDVHAGQVVKPTSEQWGLYFSGHLNFKNILDHIKSTMPAMGQMQRALLTGGSAGGVGTFKNCDWFQSYLTTSSIAAKVNCAPNAGWFFPGDTDDQPNSNDPPSDWAHWSNGTSGPIPTGAAQALWQEYLVPECTTARPKEEAFFCSSVHVLYPHIKAPVYVMENQYDTNQLKAQLGMPGVASGTSLGHRYIAYFGRAMRNSTRQVVKHPLGKTGDGIFLPSCYQHGVNNIKTKLSGFTALEGLGDWFFGRGKVPELLLDNCKMQDGLPCNPTCPGAPSGPGPAPGPSPSPGNCEAELQVVCGSSKGKATPCRTCAKQHTKELIQAGCTRKAVASWCGVGDTVLV